VLPVIPAQKSYALDITDLQSIAVEALRTSTQNSMYITQTELLLHDTRKRGVSGHVSLQKAAQLLELIVDAYKRTKTAKPGR
jgi:hypothetical protein